MSCQNLLRQWAASETGIRSVRFELHTCISNPAIRVERRGKLRRPSRRLTQAVLTCGTTRGLCEKLSGLGVERSITAKYAKVNAKGGKVKKGKSEKVKNKKPQSSRRT